MKKISLCILLVFVTVASVFSLAFTANADSHVIELPSIPLGPSGKCGERVTYIYGKSQKLLYIHGQGAMYDRADGDYFKEVDGEVMTVNVTEGVTAVGANVFYDLSDMASVFLPESLTSIGDGAFNADFGGTVIFSGTKSAFKAIETNVDFSDITVKYLKYILGDVNGDDALNNKDVVVLFKYLSGDDVEIELDAADMNEDEELNNKDIIELFKAVS